VIRLGIQKLGTIYSASTFVQPTPQISVRWQLYIYHRSGGLKKLINVGQENLNLTSISYENNEMGCGAGSFDLKKIDFPIDYDDRVDIYKKGVKDYSGYVSEIPDTKGGTVQLIPLWERSKERRVPDISIGTCTMSIANPCIVTYNSHGLLTGNMVSFTTTGALPTGIISGMMYYAIYINANTFNLAKSYDDAIKGVTITTTGSQSGTHTLRSAINYNSKTVLEILTDVFTIRLTDSGIIWNPSLISIGSTATYTVSYAFTTLEKIMQDMIGKLSTDRYWGVNENGYIFIKQKESAVTAQLFYTDYSAYSGIKTSIDTSGIKATRFINVLIKNPNGSGTYNAGSVGYAAPYPPLAIESVFRIIEDTITVPDEIGALGITQALDYAYAILQSYVPLQPITVNNVQIDKYNPSIGKMITVQDRDAERLETIINCDSITGWVNATLDTTNFVEGTGSVCFTATAIGQYIEYIFNHLAYINNPQKLVFMIRSSTEYGLFITVRYYMGIESEETFVSNVLNISSAATWNEFDFPLTDNITRIRFEVTATPSGSTQINIDRIQAFQTYNPTYTKNIVQINYDITPSSENVTVLLNTYEKSANEALQVFNNQINAINTVIKG
jgi:hypothetical protein